MFQTLYSYNRGQFDGGIEPNLTAMLFNIGATFQTTEALREFANVSDAFSTLDVDRALRGINLPRQNVENCLYLKPVIVDDQKIGIEIGTATTSVRLYYYASDTDFSQLLFAKSDGIYEVKHQRIPIAGIELHAPPCQVNGSDTFNLRYARTNSRFEFDDNGHINSDLSSANTTTDSVNFRWEPSWTDRVAARLRFNNLVDRSARAFPVSNQFEF